MGETLVETSFLMQGLITARAYFNKNNPKEKEIRDKITRIWNNVEWNWYRKEPESKFLTWHWSPDQGWIINHQLIGWNETMVTYLLAIASPTHPIPASMYYTGWANQDSTGKQYRKNWGQTDEGSMYTNGNSYYGIKLDVGVSNGGPLFFTHYSYLGFDPRYLTDAYTNYFRNNRNIALINHRYCVKNPGNYIGYSDSCWGLTASDGPYHYAANEPVLRADNGKITPTGAISSFPYTPKQSMKALRKLLLQLWSFFMGRIWF
ncbi:MAG: glucoamylase family protein [Segetibacter sp.]